MNALALAVLGMGVAASFMFFGIAFKLAKYDSREYQKNRARYDSLSGALGGKARSKIGAVPDQRVQAAVGYNHREKRFELNGKLSDHVVDEVFKV